SSAMRSSRWRDISSMMRSSSPGGRLNGARRAFTSVDQSGMFGLRDATNSLDEGFPARSVGSQHRSSPGGESIEPAPAFAFAFDPLPLDPAALLEPVQERIKRGNLEPDLSHRPLFDQPTA